jgi:hypothetical protein
MPNKPPHPDLIPVKSSMATAAHYDLHTGTMHVKFMNGDVHRYDKVPANIGTTVMGAASFGSALNKHVLGKHTSTKVA